jgi:uncharacterized membrane protein YuzA (DUF378 family)
MLIRIVITGSITGVAAVGWVWLSMIALNLVAVEVDSSVIRLSLIIWVVVTLTGVRLLYREMNVCDKKGVRWRSPVGLFVVVFFWVTGLLFASYCLHLLLPVTADESDWLHAGRIVVALFLFFTLWLTMEVMEKQFPLLRVK